MKILRLSSACQSSVNVRNLLAEEEQISFRSCIGLIQSFALSRLHRSTLSSHLTICESCATRAILFMREWDALAHTHTHTQDDTVDEGYQNRGTHVGAEVPSLCVDSSRSHGRHNSLATAYICTTNFGFLKRQETVS